MPYMEKYPNYVVALPKTASRKHIVIEAKRVEASLDHVANAHFAASRLFRSLYLSLGIITIILSTIVGIAVSFKVDDGKTISYNYPWLITVMSGIIALFSGIMTFLSPNDRGMMNLNSGNEYDELKNKVRIFWYVECNGNLPTDNLVNRLNYLTEQ